MDLAVFNDEQYLMWPRRFMLGTIVNFKDQGLFAFELWPGDNMPAEGIVRCWKLLSAQMPIAKPLRFRPCGASHETSLRDALSSPSTSAELTSDIERLLSEGVITNEELFKAVVYQPLTIGSAVGVLRILKDVNNTKSSSELRLSRGVGGGSGNGSVDGASSSSYANNKLFSLSRDDILVCDEVPNDLPPVRALVTAQLQTPLCHVALLCANRRAPNIAVRSAMHNFAHLEGKLVKLTCDMQDYSIREATEQDQIEWLQSPQGQRASVPNKVVPLSLDDTLTGIISISDLTSSKAIARVEAAIGAKASQIAKLAKVDDIPEHCFTVIRPSFVIPFSYYKQHVETAIPRQGTEKTPLEGLIERSKTMATRELANELGAVQERLIEAEQFDEALLDEVMKRLEQGKQPGGFLENSGGVIFRSSTNVEDLPGFNGAGLYLSEPVKSEDMMNREVVTETIKRVWASVWTVRGYMERNEFGLDQSQVRMAILVMPFLDASRVVANGVAITGNPFRNTFPAHFINAQIAGTAVTDNCAGTTPEQILVYDDETPTPEIVSPSSLTQGKPILHSEEIISQLFPTFKRLHRKFAIKSKESSVGHAVDIEFLILNNPERHLVILQCRPCTITYQSLH